jgi:hypothetical protein
MILHQNANQSSGSELKQNIENSDSSFHVKLTVSIPAIYLVFAATPAPMTPGSFSDPMLNIIPIAELTIPMRRALKPAIIQNCALMSFFWHAAPPQ